MYLSDVRKTIHTQVYIYNLHVKIVEIKNLQEYQKTVFK